MSETQIESVVKEEHQGVVTITLNRPAVLNAMNTDLLERLERILRESFEARAVVLCGNGSAFCAGEDLKETLAPITGKPEELRTSLTRIQEITRLISRLPCPVVAAVHGYAIGGGAELALAADLIVAGPAARFRFPEVPIGHAVTGGISARLPAVVGLLRAKEYLLTGRWIEASEARAVGLVNEIAADARARSLELAQQLAKFPIRSLSATKSGLELAAVPDLEAVLHSEVEAALHCFQSSEAGQTFETFRATGRPGPTIPS